MDIVILAYLIGSTAFIFYHMKLSYAQRRNAGEAIVAKEITSQLPRKDFYLFNDVTLNYNNHTTQIDHILICRFGIFVIETKNYAGWIFANQQAKKWTQVIYKTKSSFQNPIHQNYMHISALKKLLIHVPPQFFHNVIVFTGSASFKTDRPDNVLYPEEIISFVQKHIDFNVSEDEINKLVGIIERERYQISKATDIEHVAKLNKRFGDNWR